METGEGSYPAGKRNTVKGRKFLPFTAEYGVIRVLSSRSEYNLPEASGPTDREVITAAGRDQQGGIPGAGMNLSSLNRDAGGAVVIKANGCGERHAIGACEPGQGTIAQIASGQRHRIMQVSFHGQMQWHGPTIPANQVGNADPL